jgi:nicotinamidase-related amidase
VDIQDRLIHTIAEHAAVVQNVRTLIKAAKVLDVPILATEQEKLGTTVPELRALLGAPPFRKVSFSCCGDLSFMSELKSSGNKTVIVCGIETHICIVQTVLDLLKQSFVVLVVRDATSSHGIIDRETALARMRDSGATLTTTEAIIYELTEKSGTELFRKILDIVKEKRATCPT